MNNMTLTTCANEPKVKYNRPFEFQNKRLDNNVRQYLCLHCEYVRDNGVIVVLEIKEKVD